MAGQMMKPKERTAAMVATATKQRDTLAKVLGDTGRADQWIGLFQIALGRNPKLSQCSPESLIGCFLECATLGLRPGVSSEVHIIPYGKTATLVTDYRGLMKMITEGGAVQSCIPRSVYEGDEFDYDLAEGWAKHRPGPNHGGDDKLITHIYAVARLESGEKEYWVMSRAEIEKHRARSGSKNNGPWITDWRAMALKTVLRVFSKYLPKASSRLLRVAQLDEAASDGRSQGIAFDLGEDEVVRQAEVVEETQDTTSVDEIKF